MYVLVGYHPMSLWFLISETALFDIFQAQPKSQASNQYLGLHTKKMKKSPLVRLRAVLVSLHYHSDSILINAPKEPFFLATVAGY